MKVFLDTNIVIDFIAGRQPFVKDAITLFQLADNQEIELLVSDLSMVNMAYILRRLNFPMSDIYDAFNEIRSLLTITSIGSMAIDNCLRLRGDDFEDMAQYFSALQAGADFIVTRNKKDFPINKEMILTPREFLDYLNII